MTQASQKDILRIFPGLPDHAVARIESMRATVAELDAAMLQLSSDDTDLIELKARQGDRLNQLVGILQAAGAEPVDERD